MKTKILCLIILPLFACSFSSGDMMAGIPAARSAQESKGLLAERKARIIEHYAARPLAPFPRPPQQGYGDYAKTAISRMLLKTDLAAVSASILDPEFQPWKAGTDFSLAGSLCKRLGDYDFVLMSLIKMAYINEASGRTLLSKAAGEKLLFVLLNEHGKEIYESFKLDNCLGLKMKDTENHILVVNTARYLTNQILLTDPKFQPSNRDDYDNSKNGFDQWMLNHIAEFLKKDFSELNSRPYQGYTFVGLANLRQYAKNEKVKLISQMAMDYLVAKFALGSNDLRRYAPFRRLNEFANPSIIMKEDNAVDWAVIAIGNFSKLEGRPDGLEKTEKFEKTYIPFMGAIEDYEISDVILDLAIDKSKSYVQYLQYADTEIYYSSPSFLLTAGGHGRNVLDAGDGANDVQAQATTIIPSNSEILLERLFHIKGQKNNLERNNLCVAPGFACGYNIHVPAHIPASCLVKKDKWIFYDLKKCSVNYGFYIALHLRNGGTSASDELQENYGFIEVREPDIDFSQFVNQIVSANNKFSLGENGPNKYINSRSQEIVFNIKVEKMIYPISSIDKKKIETNPKKWPRAQGDIMTSSGDGLVRIFNPHLNRTLVLDARNPLEPVRTE